MSGKSIKSALPVIGMGALALMTGGTATMFIGGALRLMGNKTGNAKLKAWGSAGIAAGALAGMSGNWDVPGAGEAAAESGSTFSGLDKPLNTGAAEPALRAPAVSDIGTGGLSGQGAGGPALTSSQPLYQPATQPAGGGLLGGMDKNTSLLLGGSVMQGLGTAYGADRQAKEMRRSEEERLRLERERDERARSNLNNQAGLAPGLSFNPNYAPNPAYTPTIPQYRRGILNTPR